MVTCNELPGGSNFKYNGEVNRDPQVGTHTRKREPPPRVWPVSSPFGLLVGVGVRATVRDCVSGLRGPSTTRKLA